MRAAQAWLAPQHAPQITAFTCDAKPAQTRQTSFAVDEANQALRHRQPLAAMSIEHTLQEIILAQGVTPNTLRATVAIWWDGSI